MGGPADASQRRLHTLAARARSQVHLIEQRTLSGTLSDKSYVIPQRCHICKFVWNERIPLFNQISSNGFGVSYSSIRVDCREWNSVKSNTIHACMEISGRIALLSVRQQKLIG